MFLVIICYFCTTDTVTFDNSYSWFHGKKLLYQVDVLPPPENIDELKHSDSFNMDPLS